MKSTFLCYFENVLKDKGRKQKNSSIDFRNESDKKRHIRKSYLLEHCKDNYIDRSESLNKNIRNKYNIISSENSELFKKKYKNFDNSIEQNKNESSLDHLNFKSFSNKSKIYPINSSNLTNLAREKISRIDNFTHFNFKLSSISKNESVKLRKRISNLLNASTSV